MEISVVRRRFITSVVGVLIGVSLISPSLAKQSENTLQEIQQRGVFIVALEGTYPPFSYQDEDGNLAGFEVDLAHALANKLGVKLKLSPTKWDGILAALVSKRSDVVINQVTISEERKRKFDFSTPYTYSGIQALVKKGNASKISQASDLAGKRVGVGLGSNYEQWLRENVVGVDIRTYDDDPTKYQDLRIGRVDAILVDRLAALDLIQKTNNTLELGGKAFSSQRAGVALRKNNPELLEAINTALEQLRTEGVLAEISNKWFGADVTQ